MDRVFLSWTFENWVTVVLMAGLGYVLFAIVSQGVRQVLPQQMAA